MVIERLPEHADRDRLDEEDIAAVNDEYSDPGESSDEEMGNLLISSTSAGSLLPFAWEHVSSKRS